MLDVLIAGVVFLLVALLCVGAITSMSTLIDRVLGCLMVSADCAGVTQADALERARAEIMLAHFENIRAAAIADDWDRFHALNDELRLLDPKAWAEFNDGLCEANVPARRASKRRHRAG